ncbi:MAG: metallophosphoesterase [Candidatus Latescibacterota bacterium]
MPAILKGPYLQWPTQTGVTVMWETSAPATSRLTLWQAERVPWGLQGRFRRLDDTARRWESAALVTVHKVTADGLAAGATCHYQVESTDAAGHVARSAEHELRTAVGPDTPFSVAVTSETGGYGNDEINRRLFAQMARYRPDLLLIVGDSVAAGSRYGDWHRYLFGPGRELFRTTPFYLCPGNHEEDAEWMRTFVHYPGGRPPFAFEYGSALFVGLDSAAEDQVQPGGAQHRFLQEALAGSRATWKVVFFHYPPYVSADFQVDAMRALCPVLEAGGADLVLNSHAIVYERSHPLCGDRVDHDSGVVYVVVGGASMGSAELSRAAFRVRAADNMVYLIVAHQGSGSLVISPLGEVLAEVPGGAQAGELVIAEVDPRGGRAGGNAFDWQDDLRQRLFHERAPEAYGVLTALQPPAAQRHPPGETPEEITRRANGVLTWGEERFAAAEELARTGRTGEARAAFRTLRQDFPRTWIDRVAAERLASLESAPPP